MVVPTLALDLIQILPLFSSTNSLHRINPKPVPLSPIVPFTKLAPGLKMFFKSLSLIPIPLSIIETLIKFPVFSAFILIILFLLLNLTALLNKFLLIVCIVFLSASTYKESLFLFLIIYLFSLQFL